MRNSGSKIGWMVAGALAVESALAASWTGDGKLSGSTADAFNAYDSIVFTNVGMLAYTGADAATVTPNLTGPTVADSYLTLNVTDPDATFTMSGLVSAGSRPFQKYGPGKAVLSYAGATQQRIGAGSFGDWKSAKPLTFDENGKLTDATYLCALTVHEGTLVVGGPNANLWSGGIYVGWRENKDARLEVRGGTYSTGTVCLGRGNGTKASPGRSELYLCGSAVLKATGFYNAWSNYNPSLYAQPWLTVDDGARFESTGMVYVGEGTSTGGMIVTNGSSAAFPDTRVFRLRPGNSGLAGGDGSGLEIARGTVADVTVDVSGASTLSAVALGSVQTGKLKVRDGSTLEFDRTIEGYVESGVMKAFSPYFDDAILKGYTAGVVNDWFRGVTNVVTIGANGLTAQVDTYASLHAPLKKGAAGAKLVKTGSGVLAAQVSADVPIEVRAGEFRRALPVYGKAQSTPGTVTLAAGAKLGVSTTEGLRDVTYAANGATVAFRAQGVEMDPAIWKTLDGAAVLGNGVLKVSEAAKSGGDNESYARYPTGTAWLQKKVPVDRSFEVSFDYFSCQTTGSDNHQANFCCLWQNSADGVLARATTQTMTDGLITNSCMIGVNPQTRHIRYGEQGRYDNDVFPPYYTPRTTYLTPESKPLHFTIRYNATTHRISLALRPYGADGDWDTAEFACDMATLCRGTEAYFGFAGCHVGDANLRQQCVKNLRFRYSDATQKTIVRTKGTVDLSAGGTWTAELHADPATRGYEAGTLKYADGATVKIEKASDTSTPSVLPMPSLRERDLWTLVNGAHWAGDNAVACSDKVVGESGTQRRSGQACTRDAYPLNCNWTMEYDFDFGTYDGVRADWYAVGFVADTNRLGWTTLNSSTTFNVQTRYFRWVPASGSTPGYDDHSTHVLVHADGYDSYAPDGGASTELATVNLYNATKAHQKITYDYAAQKLTIVTDDRAGHSETRTWSDFDIVDKAGLTQGHIRLVGAVGGSMTENIISNFTFTFEGQMPDAAEATVDDTALAFESYAGSGRLVKTGTGNLGFMKPQGLARLDLAAGGLVLRNETDENLYGIRPGEWHFNESSGAHMANGGLKLGKWQSVDCNMATTFRRVRVDGDWTAKFRVSFPPHPYNATAVHADALHFIVHNDPSGVYHGNYNDIRNRAALHWYYYQNNSNRLDRLTASKGGETDIQWSGTTVTGKRSQSYAPIKMDRASVTDVEVRYDAAQKTLTSILTQGATVVTNTFADFDVPTLVGDTAAHLTLGINNGGWSSVAYLENFSFETATPSVSSASGDYVNALTASGDVPVILSTGRAAQRFRLTESLSVAAGKRLAVRSSDQPATLTLGALALAREASVTGYRATVAPETLSCAGDLNVSGATLAIPSADALDARKSVYLTDGAKLRIDFAGALHVRRVYVNGVRVPNGSYGVGTDWIDAGSVGTVVNGLGLAIILR